MNARFALWLFCAFASLAPVAAWAHPHSWIDIEVEVLFDGEGRVRALRQDWIFDEALTVYLTAPRSGRKAAPDPERVPSVAAEMMKNLREHDYFTRVERGGTRLALAPVASHGGRIRDARLVVTFELPLAEPAEARGSAVVYAIYDPTYFIEILHASGGKSVRLADAPAGCAARLRPPAPPADLRARALALDRNQSGGDGLGVEFAEKVTIRCGAAP